MVIITCFQRTRKLCFFMEHSSNNSFSSWKMFFFIISVLFQIHKKFTSHILSENTALPIPPLQKLPHFSLKQTKGKVLKEHLIFLTWKVYVYSVQIFLHGSPLNLINFVILCKISKNVKLPK